MITEKEKKIIEHLSNGLTQAQTAKEVLLSGKKIEKMLERLRKKFKCRTTTQLCVKINRDFPLTTKAA